MNHNYNQNFFQENMAETATDFPDTLQGFGYRFNSEGQLRSIKSDQPFEFKVSDDNAFNQRHYEALGEVITQHVFELLESVEGLKKVYIPIGRTEKEPRTFIFCSDDALTNTDKLLLLIHGSGVVRAGQWARSLIINDCLNSGSQLPFIHEAKENGYGIIVLNSNDNYIIKESGKIETIKCSENPEHHVRYVWDNFVKKAAAKHVAIIAHSYGGICTMDLLKHHEKSFKQRVYAIALTDSVHMLDHQGLSKSAIIWLQKVCRNWIASDEPLDKPMTTTRKVDVPLVSSGVKRHEMTSWSSFKSIFRFLSERYGNEAQPEVSKKEDL